MTGPYLRGRFLRGAGLFITALIISTLLPVPRALPAPPDEGSKPFVLGEIATIHSKILGEDRPLFIYTHPAYNEDQSRYPVAYVLDGEWNFRHTAGVIDLMSSREVIPWMIVVGIPNVDRDKDLSPSPIKAVPRGGGAAAFRRFLREEVFPFVETHYRTEPFRMLIGHSLAGLFAVDTLLAEPGLFNACLAVSPYLVWDDGRYLDAALGKQAGPPGRLTFLSAWLGDEPGLRPAFERLEKALGERGGTQLKSRFGVLPDRDHETVYFGAVERGLFDIFPDWRLPAEAAAAGLDGIRKHYGGLTARYGYEIRPVYFVVVMIGEDYGSRGEIDEAIRILSYAVSLNPDLPYAYAGLGACYRRKGLVEEAIGCYEKALRLAPDDKDTRKALEELKNKRKTTSD